MHFAFLHWFCLLTFVFSAIHDRRTDAPKSKDPSDTISYNFHPMQEKESAGRFRRAYDPSNSPFKDVPSPLRWRPNNLQPMGQIYNKYQPSYE